MKSLLRHPRVYIALQRAVGANILRYRCIESLNLRQHETVVDIGCGPAYYLDHLPLSIDYHGFDLEARYIKWARRRWESRGTFHLGTFDVASTEIVGSVDAVMLLGVLHHLDDESSGMLLDLVASVLDPGGRVVTLDTCFDDSQGRLSRWMAEHDRGEFVRSPEEFEALARKYFNITNAEITRVGRVPGTYWTMLLNGH